MIKFKRLKLAVYVVRKEDGKSVSKILTNKSKRRLRLKWEDIFKIHLKEIRVNTRNLIDSSQGIIGEPL